MCLVIRFPNMFGNVRACTIMCLVLREDRSWRMPLASPWFHQFWWIGGYDRRPGRRIETADQTWCIYYLGSDSAVWSAVTKPPNETAVFSPVLRMNSAVMICGLAAEWNRRFRYFRSVSFSGSILRSHSAAPTAEWNRRLCVSRAKLSFHMPCFLML